LSPSSNSTLIDIKDFACPCGEGVKGSFVRFYSKGEAQCPHCGAKYKLKDYVKIEHQR